MTHPTCRLRGLLRPFASISLWLIGLLLLLPYTLSAQLQWSVFDETSSQSVTSTSDGQVVLTVPAGARYTLYATNFVPIDWSSVTSGDVNVVITFKASGGLSSLTAGTRAIGFGLYNNNSTNPGTSFADDGGYFTWLNGRSTGSLIELRRRNADGTSPSLLWPTGSAYNSLGTGTTVQTSGALTDSGTYSIQLHLVRSAKGVSLGTTSSTTAGAGVWVSGDGLSQTAYTNPDTTPSATVFNELGFMFYNSSASAVTLTISSVTGLTTINPPSITTQPQAQIVNPGQEADFSVVAAGTAPLSYQWMKGGTAISGATSATYSILKSATTDVGSYSVTVTNAYGSVTSSAAALTVTTDTIAAKITTQPQSVTVTAGAAAAFSVSATGSAPMSYQWYKNDTAISGATANTYSIAATASADAGAYKVIVTNAGGSATSTAATLTVNTAPVITQQPASLTLSLGQSASFTVAATGTPTPSYQWLRNGVNISGATSATYAIPSVSYASAGVYTCRIVNSVGAVTSTAASLIIPSTMALQSTTPSNGATGRNTDVTLSMTFDSVPSVGNTGRILIYRASDNAVVDTINMGDAQQTRFIGTQTVAYIYYPIIVSGKTANIYPHAGVLAYGQSYYVVVEPGVIQDANGASFTGVSGTTAWRFTTKAAGPASGAAAITVAADGSGDFSTVQGAIDFVPVNNTQRVVITVKKGTYTEMCYIGATKPYITVQGEDRANCIIAYADNNNFNTLTGNNRCMFGVDATDFILQTITLHNLTVYGGSQAEAFRTGAARTLLNRVNLASYQDTFLCNGTNASAFVTDSYIEGDVDFMWGSGQTYMQRCELKAMHAGYYAQIRNGQTVKGNVYVDCRLTSDTGVTGCYLARIDPTTGNYPYSQVVWLNCAMGTHILPVGWELDNATTSSTVQYWEYKSTDLNGATLDVSKRLSSSTQLSDSVAATYRDPAYVLNGWSPTIAPTIETQPASTSAVVGTDVKLTVVANGAPEPSYQWYVNGTAIAGATNSYLLLQSVQLNNAGSYTVVVSNSVGTITSAAAVLTVSHAAVNGSYFGTLGKAGSFALYIRDNSTAVLLGNESSVGGVVGRALSLDSSGHLTGTVTLSGGSTLAVDAKLSSGSLTGTLGTLSLSGSLAASTGSTQTFAGFYVASLSGGSSQLLAIASATGRSYLLSLGSSSYDAGSGTVDSQGHLSATLASGATVTGLISSDASSTLAVVLDSKGVQTAYVGTSEGTGSALRFMQFSGRSRTTPGDGSTIVGFVIGGSTPDDVLIRGVGPGLTNLGVSGVIANPRIDLYSGSTRIATNTGWTSGGNATDLAAAALKAGAFAFTSGSADSALHISLNPGAYTVILSDANSASGVGLVEIYDLTFGSLGQRLSNISTRAIAGSGDNTLIAGVVVSGSAPKRVLVRAVGPSLSSFGLSGVLAKPVLTVYKGSNAIGTNTGYTTSADAAAIKQAAVDVGAFALGTSSADSALIINFSPGPYTIQVTSADGSTGIALVELYELP